MKNKFGSEVDKWGIVKKRSVEKHEHIFPKKFIGSVVQKDQVVSQCQVCGEWHKFDKKEFLDNFK